MFNLRNKLLVVAILWVNISVVLAGQVNNITVTMAGSEVGGTKVYVGITPNGDAYKYDGVYFEDAGELDKALSVAMSAKISGHKVRIDYTQPNGAGEYCYGYAIYLQ